jgi:steroid 5-alpha reductase family enzyme
MALGWQEQLIWIAAGAGFVMMVLWLIQLRIKDAGIVDVGWAACLGASAVFCAATGEGDSARRIIIGSIGGIWGLRLAWHLLTDRVLKGPEDGRYQMMRELFGARINPVLLVFFEAQAALVVILSVPFILASSNADPGPAVLDFIGLGIWLFAIVGETIADRQLILFKKDSANKGKVCNVKLWRYSRHPNYFFEWLIWIGFATVATSAAYGWVAWTAPSLILLFVLKFTGIPPTEARAVRSRGEAYRQYQRETSAFFPWFPKTASKNTKETSP